jgi:hypothetical protein
MSRDASASTPCARVTTHGGGAQGFEGGRMKIVSRSGQQKRFWTNPDIFAPRSIAALTRERSTRDAP